MHDTMSLLSALAIAVGVVMGPRQQAAGSAQRAIESLSWLGGAWHGEQFETQYTSPQGGMILSMSKSYDAGKASFFDFERFEVEGDNVMLTPYPGGKASVSFRLVGHDPAVQRARFTNPSHDFPQEFVYERRVDSLFITLSGEEKGKPQTLRFALARK